MDFDPHNIELVDSVDAKPDIAGITLEIEQAQIDCDYFYQRMESARHIARSRWRGQTMDGRKHADQIDDKEPFPWEGACLSLDTEILTQYGWRRVDDVKVGELVLTRSETGDASYRPVSDVTKTVYPYAVELKGKSIDLLVTPNHNMVVINRGGKQKFVPALRLAQKITDYWIPLTSKSDGVVPEKVYGLDPKSYLRLLGWYIAEGSMNNGMSVGIAQSRKSAKCSLLESDLKEAGVTWNYNGNTYWLHSVALPIKFREELQRLGGCKEKQIPLHVFDYHPDLLKELLARLIAGDGHIKKNGHTIYYTVSKVLADQIQIIAQLIGKRASISIRLPRPGGMIRGRQIKSDSLHYVVMINSKKVVQTRKLFAQFIELKDPQPFACVNVPPFHTLYVRRNGRAVWCGNSDARTRIVYMLIKEHVTFAKTAFFNAKAQAKALRPMVAGRQSSLATKVLQWILYTHMRTDLLHELPLAWWWRFEFGVSFLWIEWEQKRRMEFHDISLDDIDQAIQAMQGQGGGQNGQSQAQPMMTMLLDALTDENQEDNLTVLLQGLNPILTKPQARGIVRDLREKGVARFPVVYLISNKPRWTACRPVIDLLFPSETTDLQESRWLSRREWVTETELRDREVTEGYDKEFINEAVKHKGESELWQWDWWHHYPTKSYRELIELHHFYNRAITNGVPIIYKTVFQPLAKGKGSNPLYASHTVHPYQHGQYPCIVMRRTHEDAQMLKSHGIADECYTDEQDIKIQQDGISDRTSIVLQPPMIVPYSRVQTIKNTPLPGAVMGANRPQEVQFLSIPPVDQTPVEIINMVMSRLDRRYSIYMVGKQSDPSFVQMRRAELAGELLGELELAAEQTFQLAQQYFSDEEVARIVGKLGQPWNVSREEIQGKHQISITFDSRMFDEDYATHKMDLFAKLMPFKQEGLVFKAAMEIVDPDIADEIAQDQASPEAIERERGDEENAFAKMLSGVEPTKPIYGNHKVRYQKMMEIMQQPNMPGRMASLPQDSKALIQNRMKFFQAQIQQYEQNPMIGRSLSTKTFQPQMAPELSALPAA